MATTRRINRIIKSDGRTLIVAMDHSLIAGSCKGLRNPGETIAKVIEGGADAVLTSYGIAKNFSRELAPVALIVRVDGGTTKLGSGDGPDTPFFGVEEALRLGAEAIAVCAYPGSPVEKKTLETLARTVSKAHAWGLPVVAEMLPGGLDVPEARTTENIALSSRVGAELGADMIKTPYVSNFEAVTSACYVPVVVLGGSRRATELEILSDVKAAVDAGAAGVAIGRNIFQAEDPTRMTAAFAAILHLGASVEEAVDILKGR